MVEILSIHSSSKSGTYRLLLFFFLILLTATAQVTSAAENNKSLALAETDTIENFNDGVVELHSWADQDLNPASWSLNSSVTYNSTPFSLRLFGNTWKLENIEPRQIDSGEVWQTAAYIQSVAEIQGFGITDSVNTLFYSFAGTEQLNTETWITVYQGAFPNNTWNLYLLPVADDWFARFGYLPVVKGIIFINDRDNISSGIVYFDEIIDITNILPVSPNVNIQYSVGEVYRNNDGLKSVQVQFTSEVYDPDSEFHSYLWNFGDDSTSSDPDPLHTFIVEDDHDYTVFLTVTDQTSRIGTASCRITVDPGTTTFPVTLNFVGDIIFARRIQTHINTYGYQSLFIPTAPYLGNAADITVANLESPLTTSTAAHPTKPILLKGNPAHAPALKYGGIDLVTLANNHIIDYGLTGLQQTQSAVRANDVICFGAGADSYEALKPVFYSKSGLNFAFLGSSDRTGQYNNYQPYLEAGVNKPGFGNLTDYKIISQINSVRDVADFVIMEMHSGSEYSIAPFIDDEEAEFYSPFNRFPSEGDREVRRFAIDNGADAVICHHPHIIHGFEVYKEKLIAHSLGNFIFDLDYPETYPSMILNAKVGTPGIYNYTVVPVYIDDYVPKRAEGELGLYLLDDLAKKSKDMDTYLRIDRESATAEIILDTTAIEPKRITSEEVVNLKLQNGSAVSAPLALTKTGSISSVVSIEPAASWEYRLGRQLIWFGNFEDEGCTLWAIDNADEWYDTTYKYQGLRSFCLKRTAGQLPINTNLEEKILFYSDTSEYTLHSHILSDNFSSAGVGVQFYQTRTSTTQLGYAELTADTSSQSHWVLYTKDFTLPALTDFVNLRLRMDAPSSGTSYTRFDNTGIIEWGSWMNLQNVSSIPYPNDYYFIQIRNSNSVLTAMLNYEETSLKDAGTTSLIEPSAVPSRFSLEQNYPNPFNPVTTIEYEVPFTTQITLKVYNVLGQEVRTLVNESRNQGKNFSRWDGKDNQGRAVTSGVYFYRLEAKEVSITKKLMLLK